MSDRRQELEELLLRADWDDAPIRVRSGRSKHTRLWLSILGVCIAFGAVANYLDSKQLIWQINEAAGTASPAVVRASSTAPNKSQPAAISHSSKQRVDNYDEQVNRLLAEPAVRPFTTEPKQTAFNDANYVPATQVNTVSMRQPRSAIPSVQSPKPKPGYVTVVKETKPSCWPFKPGSIDCRSHKKAMKSAYNHLCYNSERKYSAACRKSELYNPVK
ncbi:hypothetical protein [Pseudomonas sp. OIL-1]|uniref:hypothetical protein n=1 Tax=Pseudomonas sp. OIL-1 TaxID=2706126 RepID=UPI0013A78E00|nr:hypothetical protein [Pseudomonas sp. OIL-1]QIB51792.1 hypothetical protein G3M63_12480 [Pseudomonas sp. OIL-1]